MKKLSVLFLTLLFLSSCGTLNLGSGKLILSKKDDREATHINENKNISNNESKTYSIFTDRMASDVYASADQKEIVIYKEETQLNNQNVQETNCDKILLKSGEEIEAKVLEIGVQEIKYKNCSNLQGPTISLLKSDAFMITYANGSKEVFKEAAPQTTFQNIKSSENDLDICSKGRLDADNFHGKNGGHFILGVLFGPLAIIITSASNITPERGKLTYLMSNNKELFAHPEYNYCYKKNAKKKLLLMELLGWATWILILIII
ncbi:hypothetical protein [Flavobacterium sp.]|jgi:hypothetical protein|uniref:hypothetical protein n=1 Tax=Flavobacterium sp. TaxID=239 RepID=UPI0037BE3718